MNTTPQSPAMKALDVAEVHGSGYPEPFKSRMGDRIKRRLGDAFGLSQFGVNLVRLGPGGQSALRHWHTQEDEFVYLLEGELVLVTNAGERLLRAGDCAGYPAGLENAHHLLNRSDTPALYLEVGSRLPGDTAHYPDDDLMWVTGETSEPAGLPISAAIAAHKDGRRY